MTAHHVAVVPVKPPGVGKSRLRAVPATARGRLAVAFATDTLRACLTARRVDQVLVVTEDSGFAEYAASLGATVTGESEAAGLNAALRHGATVAERRWPAGRPFALCADLPALVPDELDAALAGLGEAPAFVADIAGTGTTFYSAAYEAFEPRFGTESALAHRSAGAQPVTGPLAGLRHDVDDGADLTAAIELGVGPATRAALAVVSNLTVG